MDNKERTFVLDEGVRYTFFIAHARDNGDEVLAASWDNGTASDTIWTMDSTSIPEDEEDAEYALDNYNWAVNQARELLENMEHYNLYWKESSDQLTEFFNDNRVSTWWGAQLVIIDVNDNDGTAVYVDSQISDDFLNLAEQYGLEWE